MNFAFEHVHCHEKGDTIVIENEATDRFQYAPDYVTEPGSILQETIDSLGISYDDLATKNGLSSSQLQNLFSGSLRISSDIAEILERITNVPSRFWKNLEANFQDRQLHLARSSLTKSANGSPVV